MKCIRCGMPEKSFGDGHACKRALYDFTPKVKRRTVALVCITGQVCRRYVGHTCTHALEVERALTPEIVEEVRTNPTSFLDVDDGPRRA